MSDQDCNCADLTDDRTTERTGNSHGWIDERSVTTARFPPGVAEQMSRFFGESIDGFDDLIAAVRTAVEGDGTAVDELCHVDEETPHVARTDDETYYFRCFYDGIVLTHLVDEPVEIRTETPTNEPVEIRASPEGGIDVTPAAAVMSFGVATDTDRPSGAVSTAQELYGVICPYVRAFHTRTAYERWAADVAAATVGLPLESGVDVAAALTATSPAVDAERNR